MVDTLRVERCQSFQPEIEVALEVARPQSVRGPGAYAARFEQLAS